MIHQWNKLAKMLARSLSRRQALRCRFAPHLPSSEPRSFDFDALARDVAQGLSRRQALQRLGWGIGSALLGSLGLAPELIAAPNPCPKSQTLCSGVCVSTSTDPKNCGACGVVCPSGITCASGKCTCPTGQTLCSGACTNLQADAKNCGKCGTVCATGASCTSGKCACLAGQTVCNGACVTTSTDPANCGRCGKTCAASLVCSGGACACPAGATNCSGTCTNLQTDAKNCGACGHTCATGQSCCGGTCTSLQTDARNCGACGHACLSNQACTNGTCVYTNPNACTSNAQCIARDPSLLCCCQPGPGQLGDNGDGSPYCTSTGDTCSYYAKGTCIGSCTSRFQCPGYQLCVNGACELFRCSANSQCSALDPVFTCCCQPGPGQLGENGDGSPYCITSYAYCQQGSCLGACPGSQLQCSGSCIDPQTDRSNCGACGHACPAGETCVGGQCTCGSNGDCTGGKVCCSGVCADLQSDAQNCGTCGHVCASGNCSKGLCCSAGLTNCCPSGSTDPRCCVNLQIDRYNCGTCGNNIGTNSGLTCVNGMVVNGPICGGDQWACGYTCVYYNSDPSNCGYCGIVCPAGWLCVQGHCTAPISCSVDVDCQQSPTASSFGWPICCSGTCVDAAAESNCGGCGLTCGPLETCLPWNPAGDGGGYVCTCNRGYCPQGGGACPTDEYGNISGVCCRSPQILCGGSCYGPGALLDKIVSCCNGQPYDPSLQECCAGQTVCSTSQGGACCGNSCFYPQTQQCCSTGDQGLHVCPLDSHCCGNTCCGPASEGYNCFGGAICCPPDNLICGLTCYDSRSQSCCAPGGGCSYTSVKDDIICSIGTEICCPSTSCYGYECYPAGGVCPPPYLGEPCFNETTGETIYCGQNETCSLGVCVPLSPQ